MPSKLYTIRIIRAKDIDLELEKIIDFYTANHDPRNADRDALTLLTSIKDRYIFTVEDTDNNIVAISCIFRKGMHLEKGGTRVIKNGFGFQKILNWCIACQLFIFEDLKGIYFCKVAEDNQPSIKSVIACGFTEFEPDPNFITTIGDSGKNTKTISYYQLQNAGVKQNAQRLISLFNNPVLNNNRTGESITLVFDFPLLRNNRMRDIVISAANDDDFIF